VAFAVEPAEGMILLSFLEEEDEEEKTGEHSANVARQEPDEDDPILAIVDAVGKKVTNCKAGDTVFVRSYARHGIEIGDSRLVESYCVVARIKK
jgi:hypothetical protein